MKTYSTKNLQFQSRGSITPNLSGIFAVHKIYFNSSTAIQNRLITFGDKVSPTNRIDKNFFQNMHVYSNNGISNFNSVLPGWKEH